MAKKVDPLKAKQKRQKIIAAVGGVLLIGLLAFQVPRVMKQLNKKPAPHYTMSTPSSSATPAGGTPSLAAPTLSGSEQAPTATTASSDSGTFASDSVAPPVEQGQLASFSRFASKDPFAQQLSDDTLGSSSPSGGSGSGGSGGGGSAGSGGTSIPSPSGGGGSEPAPGSAVISVNGTLVSVTTGTDFPQPTASDPSAQPLFHLVSLTAHTAKVSIVGGSYTSGAAAVTLRENKPVTLMNTADGTRYKLVLKPQGTEVPGTGTGTTTTPTVTLPPATP